MVSGRSLSSEIVQRSIANLDNTLLDYVLCGTRSQSEAVLAGTHRSLPNAEFELPDPLGNRIHHLLFHRLGCSRGSHDKVSIATGGSSNSRSYECMSAELQASA